MEEEKSKEDLQEIIKSLRKKMIEIDELTKEIKEKRKDDNADPEKTKKLLEELKVPALELLK
jgi:O-phosphoseryl-tRNA(Cys) synthetase